MRISGGNTIGTIVFKVAEDSINIPIPSWSTGRGQKDDTRTVPKNLFKDMYIEGGRKKKRMRGEVRKGMTS